MSEPTEDKPDWPQQATETIVGFVDNVKHKTTRPATMASRAVVYGIVIVALGVPALIMLLVGLVHFLDMTSEIDENDPVMAHVKEGSELVF